MGVKNTHETVQVAYDTRIRSSTKTSTSYNMSALTQISGMPIEKFMTEYWHSKPYLFKKAFPKFEPICDIDTIHEMASDEDIESRLIKQTEGEWSLDHGPFEDLPDLQIRQWTVLIQGLDQHLPEAYDLLNKFRFIPDARLDDIMLSLASDGGGVGPHYDSYDVFLLQMHGRRHWKIGPIGDGKLIEGAPLKLLENFKYTEEFILEPGDMLYLPPNYGHDGVAQGVCSTLSVGFRALTKSEVLANLLRDMADAVEKDETLQKSLFSDPLRGVQTDPSEIPKDLLDFGGQTFNEYKPSQDLIRRCMGLMLSEPKSGVYFPNNSDELDSEEIVAILGEKGLALGMRTRMLFDGSRCFINGECIDLRNPETLKLMKDLANKRELEPDTATIALQNPDFKFFIVGFAKAGWIDTIYE